MSLSKFGSIAALCALAVVAQPAFADASKGASVSEMPVYFGDLNLQSASGAQTLVARISSAAQSVCGARPMVGPGALLARQRRAACVKQAERSAVARVNQASVTAAYALKTDAAAERIATR